MTAALTSDEEKVRNAVDLATLNSRYRTTEAIPQFLEASAALWRMHEARLAADSYREMQFAQHDRLERALLQVAAGQGDAKRLAREALVAVGYEERNWPREVAESRN